MTCPNCHTRVPVLLEGPADTAEMLQLVARDLTEGTVVRLVRPSGAAKTRRRLLTEIARELQDALQEERKAEELALAADKAARHAAHAKVEALRRVTRLRTELQQTAEGTLPYAVS